MLTGFEQNMCKVLQVREYLKFASSKRPFSTGFSTEAVENYFSPRRPHEIQPKQTTISDHKPVYDGE
jgi:hypothetical protein